MVCLGAAFMYCLLSSFPFGNVVPRCVSFSCSLIPVAQAGPEGLLCLSGCIFV